MELKDIKKIIKSNKLLYNILKKYKKRYNYYKALNRNKVSNLSEDVIIMEIRGIDNTIDIKKYTHLANLDIVIKGNNNLLIINENVSLGLDSSILIEGNNCKIFIGACTTATRLLHINAQEDYSEIYIGKDCMFSNNIIIRTSDSHPIIDQLTGNRLNNPQNVYIGNHVWVAPNTKIMKGANISHNTVIGSDTTVTGSVPANVLFIGRPGKIIKHNINWTREKLF